MLQLRLTYIRTYTGVNGKTVLVLVVAMTAALFHPVCNKCVGKEGAREGGRQAGRKGGLGGGG